MPLNHISSSTKEYFRTLHRRPPSHEKAATVDEIIKLAPITDRYGYLYWLSLLKRSGVKYNEMMGILKNVEGADPKYPKGALITKRLCEIAKTKRTIKLLK